MAVALLQVKPSPTADFTSDVVEGCEPLSVNFSSESNFANAFNWNFGNGESASTETAAQEFFANGENTAFDVTLTVTHELGCTDTATETVTAFPSALVDLAFDSDSACSP